MPFRHEYPTDSGVLDKLQPYMNQSLERALDKVDIIEERVLIRCLGFELYRTRRATHSYRRRWRRWVSLIGFLALLATSILKMWL